MEAGMMIAAMAFRLHAPWVHSLKEKEMQKQSTGTAHEVYVGHEDDHPGTSTAVYPQ